MNDYDSSPYKNVKILVRIRNHPGEKDISDGVSDQNQNVKEERVCCKTLSRESVSREKSRSKSPTNSKNSTPILKLSNLLENKKYTFFTTNTPSSTLVVSDKPITGKLINNTFLNENDIFEYSYSILTDASILQYDRVFNETHKIESIYTETVKDSINNLFTGKSSSLFVFGPKNSGKSFTLRGGNEGKSTEIGILGRAVQDIFNLVEISKQANFTSKTIGAAYFSVKLSVYQVYMGEINDLLSSTGYTKNLKIEKFYDDTNQLCTNISNLTQKEIKNKRDYDLSIKEAMSYRKNLAQYLKVNELKRKSHLVISISLEKREKINESYKSAEKSIEKYSQIDFVELAASEYGIQSDLADKEINLEDKSLFKDTSKTFNSLCNNIVSASVGSLAKQESKLTLALKSTLRRDSQISFLNCVQPYEVPLAASFKSLKFTNWLRNQVHNIRSNLDYQIKTQYEESDRDLSREDREDREGQSKYKKNYNYNDRYLQERKEFLEDEVEQHHQQYKRHLNYNYEEDPREMKNITAHNLNSQSIDRRFYSSSEEELRGRDNLHRSSSPKKRENVAEYDIGFKDDKLYKNKERKLKEMEESLKHLEAKSLEISRSIENIRHERSKTYEDPSNMSNMNSPQNMNSPHNINKFHKQKASFDYDNERLKHENATLKSDTIIFREDINRLTDVNRHLEEELSRQRNRNLELAADNERLNQERMGMKNELDKMNENLSKVKVQEHNIVEQMNQRFLFENKMRELESENRTLREEKQKFEVEFRVLSERHSELKKNFESTDGELNYLKQKQTEEVNNIENKLEKMAKEIECLQRENNSLRINEERIRTESSAMEKQRDNYRDKYQDYKSKNNLLNVKLVEIEDEFRKLVLEKQVETFEKKKDEESKKMKSESKNKILEDMQMRILNYKTELFRQRNKKDDF